jgi:hypothetical protein
MYETGCDDKPRAGKLVAFLDRLERFLPLKYSSHCQREEVRWAKSLKRNLPPLS